MAVSLFLLVNGCRMSVNVLKGIENDQNGKGGKKNKFFS